MDLSILF